MAWAQSVAWLEKQVQARDIKALRWTQVLDMPVKSGQQTFAGAAEASCRDWPEGETAV